MTASVVAHYGAAGAAVELLSIVLIGLIAWAVIQREKRNARRRNRP